MAEDGVQWGPPLRILAPIFDFVNHASNSIAAREEGCVNANFGIENEKRSSATCKTSSWSSGRGVTWRCLTSYDFVPEHDVRSAAAADGAEERVEEVAELWMKGLW